METKDGTLTIPKPDIIQFAKDHNAELVCVGDEIVWEDGNPDGLRVVATAGPDSFASLVADCERDIKRIDVMLVERDRLIALEATVDGLKVRLDALEKSIKE